MSKPATYSDGLHDGQQIGLFMALRIIKAEKKLHAYNSGAGRVLKTIEAALMRQAEGSDMVTTDLKVTDNLSNPPQGAAIAKSK